MRYRIIVVRRHRYSHSLVPAKLQFTLRTLLILTTALAVLLGVGRWAWDYLSQDEYHVATFDCGHGRKIIVTAESYWEIAQSVHYRVVVDGQTVVPTWSFDLIQPDEKVQYDLVTAEKGELAAVVSDRSGGELRILHDFRTGESWPANDVGQKTLLETLGRLRAENPGVRISVNNSLK